VRQKGYRLEQRREGETEQREKSSQFQWGTTWGGGSGDGVILGLGSSMGGWGWFQRRRVIEAPLCTELLCLPSSYVTIVSEVCRS
jgi:hypothetical protein